MKRSRSPRWLLFILLASALCGTAGAQALPANIPDTPGESLIDRQKEQQRERHLGRLSRLFALGEVGYTFAASEFPAVARMTMGGGYRLGGHTAVYASIASWTSEAGSEQPAFIDTQAIVAIALGLDLGLDRLTSVPVLARHGAVGFSTGVLGADQAYFFAEVMPKAVLQINRFWSVPIGLKVGAALVSSESALPYVGLSVGVRRHFGQRETME